MMWRMLIPAAKLLPLLLISQLHGQGRLMEEALQFLYDRDQIASQEPADKGSFHPCSTLLIDCWLSKINDSKIQGNFGLRFKPVDDRNIYLLYQYELKSMNASTELGFSVNYFNAFSIKYVQTFSVSDLN